MGMTPIYIHAYGLSFGWFSNESGEPPHVHVFRGSDRNTSAKFWLRDDGVELAHNDARLSAKELRQAAGVINANRYRFISRWCSFFGGDA